MYSYAWDKETGGIQLCTESSRLVSFELRPVFAEEIVMTGMSSHFDFDSDETRPLMWAIRNEYYVYGEKVAQITKTAIGRELNIVYFFKGIRRLIPVDVEEMVSRNSALMGCIVADTKRRTKELFDEDQSSCDIAYIAFSGGKDSTVLLDICDQVLPTSVPVVYNDTDMELPDSYQVWNQVQGKYPLREYIKTKSESRAIENWVSFGPPARNIKWCCSVHKSTPAIIALKERLNKDSVRAMAFVGVRGEESYSRSLYEDSNDGLKNASQKNKMPLLEWSSHEIWLYIFQNKLIINRAYRLGLPRVGCVLCPESSTRYEWIINQTYPDLIESYNKVICQTSSKEFDDESSRDDYVSTLGWQARKSGIMLKESVSNPMESTSGNVTTFTIGECDADAIYEWFKTIGRIFNVDGRSFVEGPKTSGPLGFSITTDDDGHTRLDVSFNDEEERKRLLTPIRNILRKSISCIACRTCEAECRHGALSFNHGRVSVDTSKCVSCQRCLDLYLGCWRFRSMYKPETETKRFSTINSYFNFGLRETDGHPWVSYLVNMRDSFFPYTDKHPLGNKMVDSASKWFQQSLLVSEKSRHPTRLVDVFAQEGGDSKLGWELIWIALANNSTLIRWFVTNTDFDKECSVAELSDSLKEYDPSLTDSTIKGALSSLRDLVTKSPVGTDGGFVVASKRGNNVVAYTRTAHPVESITVLYSLYLISNISDRSNFSVSKDFVGSDFGSAFIPPTDAFGIPLDEFKKICIGLHSKYPDYIDLTFTHGNDVLTVFPDKHSLDDVIGLILRRYRG